MDIYKMTIDFLSGLPEVWGWPDLQAILLNAASRRPRDWLLPVVACEAVGGTPEQAAPASAAVACLQISILLIDDMLDADPRGEYHRRGMPATANLAAAFQAAGLEAVAQSKAGPETRLAALFSLNRMALVTALGQYLDLQNPAGEAAYWRLVRTKSSPFFGAALQAGALFGGASAESAGKILRFGRLYGEMIQIHDDLNDAMAVPAGPDWVMGRSSLPVLYALSVEHPDRDRFQEALRAIPDPAALAEAQTILIRCGAVSFVVDQLVRRDRKARRVLASAQWVRQDRLDGLLEDLIEPVRKLFSGIGVEPADLLHPPVIPPDTHILDRLE